MHHLDSWIKIDQLDVTCFIISLFTAQHVSNVSLQELAIYCGFISCVVFLWFDMCWCNRVVRLGWCVILMQAEALKCFTCFIISLFTARHVSNVSTFIFRSLLLIVDLSHVLYCSSSMCVGVTVWFGWVVWYPYEGWGTSALVRCGCNGMVRLGSVVSLWRLRH